MLRWIDNFLNKITMYRLVLYVLVGFLGFAFVFCALGIIHYNPLALLFSTMLIVAICWACNAIFARIFKAPTNIESFYITALILALIISPLKSPTDMGYFTLAISASIIAMASKFLFAVRNKHIFNPAAAAVALTSIVFNQPASWWVGTLCMVPVVLVGGLLIARKIRRADLMVSFFFVAMATILASGFSHGFDLLDLTRRTVADTPILFFAFVMLTEPLTTPPTRPFILAYGAIVGFLFAPETHIGSFYFTPELALLAGNLFSYAVSPKTKLLLKLDHKEEVANQTFDFVFRPNQKLNFTPGQYLEWTLDQEKTDNRGNRRYFTVASSPTEQEIRMGVKFYPNPSTFKQRLLDMKTGDLLVASQLAGDFTLPKDRIKKLAFIAGGIGVTPFRSIVKYLVDTNEKRDIIFFYSNKVFGDIAYKELFDEASKKLSIKMVYTLTEIESLPANWKGSTGFIDAAMIRKEAPDFQDRIFYISGPHAMVANYQKALTDMGVPRWKVKIDFFPGFA